MNGWDTGKAGLWIHRASFLISVCKNRRKRPSFVRLFIRSPDAVKLSDLVILSKLWLDVVRLAFCVYSAANLVLLVIERAPQLS